VVKEYMVVEDLQFVFYVMAMIMSVVLARRLWRTADMRLLGGLYGAAAAGLFFVAGEEVSWGGDLFERIFPWWPKKTELRQVNAQGETTLHNLNGLGHVFTWLLFALALYGAISPLVRAPVRRWVADRWLDFVVFPRATVPALLIAVAFFVTMLFLTGSHHHVQHGTGEEAFLRYQEIAELDISFSLVVFVLGLLRATTGGSRVDARWSVGR
jgi:hypothetical protein